MHLPRLRLRLRLRTLLVAVAVLGTALGGWQMWKRREQCLQSAARIERLASINTQRIRRVRLNLNDCLTYVEATRERMGRARDASEATRLERLVTSTLEQAKDYETMAHIYEAGDRRYQRLISRYRHVARYPWLPMPKEPE